MGRVRLAIFWWRGVLEHLQLFHDLVGAPSEAGFVAIEDGEQVALLGHGHVGKGGAHGGFADAEFGIDNTLFAGEGNFESAGLDGPDALEAPAAGGQLMNEVELETRGGGILLHVVVEEFVELGRIFGGEDHGFAGESVASGVPGRTGFAFWSDGSAAAGCAGLRILELQ